MLIGLSGYIGSGKDTCASILEQHHGFQRLSFASAIKDIVSSLFGWDRDDLEGSTPSSREWREEIDTWWTEQLGRIVTPRIILQMVGTEMFRDCLSPRFWTTVLKRKIEKIQERGRDRHPPFGGILLRGCPLDGRASRREQGHVL